MKTYQANVSPDGRLIAFEIESAYIGAATVTRLLQQAKGISEVNRRRIFSGDGDVHVRFKYRGHPCIVWEPYGDNSRYWLGPENPEAFIEDMRDVEHIFNDYNPPMYRKMLGNLLSLRFLKDP